MSIAKTKEAIEKLPNEDLYLQGDGLPSGEGCEALDTGLRSADIKALSASHTRLLRESKLLVSLVRRACPAIAADLDAGMLAAIAEAEK